MKKESSVRRRHTCRRQQPSAWRNEAQHQQHCTHKTHPTPGPASSICRPHRHDTTESTKNNIGSSATHPTGLAAATKAGAIAIVITTNTTAAIASPGAVSTRHRLSGSDISHASASRLSSTTDLHPAAGRPCGSIGRDAAGSDSTARTPRSYICTVARRRQPHRGRRRR